jgi:hypothetical protein
MDLKLCVVVLLFSIVHGYSTYPRRYARESEWGTCPSQCQCVTLNSREPRDLLFSDWASDEPWYSKSALDLDTAFQQDSNSEASGRSMICQGLRQLPSPLPKGTYTIPTLFLMNLNIFISAHALFLILINTCNTK